MHTKYAKALIFALAVFSLNSAKAEISWSVGPDLPNPYNEPAPFTRYHGMAYCNGYVYVIGGNIAGGEHVPEDNWPLGDNPHIYYAKVESPGVLGEWSVASANLPGYPGSDLGGTSPLKPHYMYIGRRTFSYNGKIYVVGGYGSYPTSGSAYPERAQTLIITPEANGDIIESSMVIQDWDTAPARWESSVTVNPETGAVYMVSGFNSPGVTGNASQSDEIYCAQIQEDGFLSPWNFFGNLSISHDASSQNQSNICWMPAVVLNNRLYTIAGRIGAGTIRSTQYCDLNTITTGSVQMIDNGEAGYLPDARLDHGATVLNGKIYIYGGCLTNNSNSSPNTYVAETDPVSGAITGITNINQGIPAVTVAGGSAIQGLRRIPNGVTDGQAIYLAGGIGANPADTATTLNSNATYIAKENANVENFFLY